MKPSYILSLTLATRSATVAIHKEDKSGPPLLLGQRALRQGASACERLFIELEDLQKQGSVDPQNYSKIIVCDGPGSFTGLRIAFSVAKALGTTWGVPLICVHSAQVRAHGWLERNEETLGSIGVVTKMTSRQFILTRFENSQTGLKYVSDECLNFEALVKSFSAIERILFDESMPECEHLEQARRYPLVAEDLPLVPQESPVSTKVAGKTDYIKVGPTYFSDLRFASKAAR